MTGALIAIGLAALGALAISRALRPLNWPSWEKVSGTWFLVFPDGQCIAEGHAVPPSHRKYLRGFRSECGRVASPRYRSISVRHDRRGNPIEVSFL